MENTRRGQFRIILNCIFFIGVSNKQQATSMEATSNKPGSNKLQAIKIRAASIKRQAASII